MSTGPASLIALITSPDAATRDRSLDDLCTAATFTELLAECDALDAFRRESRNLYERVRALFFLHAIHRFHLPSQTGAEKGRHHPVPRLRASARSDASRTRSSFSPRPKSPTARRMRSHRRSHPHITGSPFRRSPIRSAAACVRCAGTNGCFAWAIRRISRSASAPNCCTPAPTDRIPSSASRRPCAWISRTPRGATSSSSAWTIPRARAC